MPAPTLKLAIEIFAWRELDAFATNKPILFEMSDQMAGVRVLGGRWGVEHVAIAIPKGSERALEEVRRFVDDARSSGLVAQAAPRAGLRGAIEDE